MIRLLLFLILLVGSVWLGLQIYADPGYALFTYRGWTVEMPLWFAAFVIIAIFILIYSFMRLIARISGVSKRVRKWSRTRRIFRARKETNCGLIQLLEGHWHAAEVHLIRAAKISDTPLINYLAAARAAQEQSEHDKRDDYLRLAHETTPEAQIAIGLTQAELQLQHQQLEQALATLRHLQAIAPHHIYCLQLLKTVYWQLQDWQNLYKLLPELHKYKVYRGADYQKLERCILHQLLISKIKTKMDDDIRNLWDGLPRALRRDPMILADYCHYLIQQNCADEAEILVREQLKRDWDIELVKLYGQIKSAHPEQQLLIAETWLKGKEHSADLLLCLGRICRHAKLWTKARDYLTTAIEIKPNADNHSELAQLFEDMNEITLALQHYQQGLRYRKTSTTTLSALDKVTNNSTALF